jgi:hypothetical protein
MVVTLAVNGYDSAYYGCMEEHVYILAGAATTATQSTKQRQRAEPAVIAPLPAASRHPPGTICQFWLGKKMEDAKEEEKGEKRHLWTNKCTSCTLYVCRMDCSIASLHLSYIFSDGRMWRSSPWLMSTIRGRLT